jgi:hypothetical protein
VSPSDKVQLAIAFVAQFGAIVAVWIQAASAKRLSKPTGNGFAQRVFENFNRIENKIDSHLEHHIFDEMMREKDE